jgi:hypothetical protein
MSKSLQICNETQRSAQRLKAVEKEIEEVSVEFFSGLCEVVVVSRGLTLLLLL